jgi:hypothetical protein
VNIRARIYGGADAAEEPILKAKKPKGAKADTLQSVNVQRDVQRASNSRGEDRYRLTDEFARISHNGIDLDVELINLSGGGAMIAAPFEPLLWDRVDLHLGSHGTVECAVRWIRDDRVGLEFAHETRLDGPSDQMAILLRHVIERTFPHIHFAPKKADAAKPEVAEQRDPNDHRDGPRHPLIWTGVLYHDYQTTKIRVRNISKTGAMIESATPVRVGAQPLLELSDAVSLSATVEWAVGDQVGVRFHEPFDMHMLVEGKPSVVQEKWSPPPYLDLVAKANSEGDHWQRLTLVELRNELEGFLKR